ncbi:MAG: tryptophan--tRNA ligase, partial [Epsilonproteobacteria bacterium]|nr:tryptophan--tRNA ligase [Campylobacterota bacterium]
MRIVSGMRPTGKLHLGHYLGVIKKWLELQSEHESYFFVADWHALSTTYEDRLNLKNLSIELVKDWLSCGIDPEKSVIFIQSHVKYHAELYLLLNMITPLGWLERNPTYKEQIANLEGKDIHTAGFLTYPVLQAADIILYDADFVPIGEDQRPHLEITREIVRRFHHLYNSDIFKEPKEILSPTSRLLGLDGRKMSKSYNNSIYLTESSEEIFKKIKTAITDTQRVKKTDAGNPKVCLVNGYHEEFSTKETIEYIQDGCINAKIGCMECKKLCFESIDKFITPIREKRATIDDKIALEIALDGSSKAQKEAKRKMEHINHAIFN